MPRADQQPGRRVASPVPQDQVAAVPGPAAAAASPAAPGASPARPEASRAAPGLPFTDQLDRDVVAWTRNRRLLIEVLVAFYLASPLITAHRHGPPEIYFLLPATVAMIVLSDLTIMRIPRPAFRPATLLLLTSIIGIAVAILAVGGINWVNALIMAGAAAGRLARNARDALIGALCCVAGGVGVMLHQGIHYDTGLVVVLVPPMAAFFAFAATRRAEIVLRLRATRAELARMAVAEERLRIARDLHDLLGHSLSLITLKAELAGRVIGTDHDRAVREIAELEAVARQSLAEVRATVSSYRQPGLAAELAAARQMLAAAGMECRVEEPASLELAPEGEALLAWTVREGATNVVRHSGARGAAITVTVDAGDATVEITDDGVGVAWDGDGRQSAAGSGLVGLAERARAAGGEISVGEGPGGKGFCLRVRVPAQPA
jgi:two-component system, NarL family, sensor histidine kinase DesK